MGRARYRRYLVTAALSVFLPLAGLTYCLAQGAAASNGGSMNFNWPSVVLTVVGMLLGSGVVWGMFRERVKQYGVLLAEHEKRLGDLGNVYVSRELCVLKEQVAAAAAAAAAREAAQSVVEVVSLMEQAHRDMTEIVAEIKRMLERQGG